MDARAPRHLSERDLRALSTDDLLSLIHSDIQELDRLITARKRTQAQDKKPVKAGAAPHEPEPELIALHSVTCCGHHMGDFLPVARVRCPFCNQWHRAGDFPLAG